MRSILAAAFLLLGIGMAHAACEIPPTQPSPDGVTFLLGIDPSDGILDAWCRVQSMQGDYEVVVNFLDKGVKSSFKTTFDGTPSQDRMVLATFIQSLLPTAEGPALDANGMNFGSVLESAVQARAAKTPISKLIPSAEEIGIPEDYDFANDLILWTPVTLDIKPVRIAGVDFTLRISFRPSIGRYLMAKNGLAEGLTIKGWHKNVLAAAGPFRDNCPDTIPVCKDFGEVIDVHTAWTLNSITLHAEGSGLSAATLQLFKQLIADNPQAAGNPMRNFDATVGDASFEITGASRVVRARAEGDPNKVAGTQLIQVRWEERPDSRQTYRWLLGDYATRMREAMVMATPKQGQ